MFGAWQVEKAVEKRVDEAQAMADRLAAAKPHQRDALAADVAFWAASYQASGVILHDVTDWPPAEVKRFAKAVEAKVAALRKARSYASSDGLAVWLHTARAVQEPRIAPPVRTIWALLAEAGPNASSMAADLLAEAGLTAAARGGVPKGFVRDDD